MDNNTIIAVISIITSVIIGFIVIIVDLLLEIIRNIKK